MSKLRGVGMIFFMGGPKSQMKQKVSTMPLKKFKADE